jgi:hypothetical protein
MRYVLMMTFMFLIVDAQSQTAVSDTTYIYIAKANSVRAYEKSLHGITLLHNGTEYVETIRTGDAHPFFVSDDWQYGSVDYDNAHFDSAYLLLDLTVGRLIAESAGSMPIELIKEKIKSFSIGTHQFIKLNPADYNNSLPARAFYEILYNGTSRVVVYHEKSNKEDLVDRAIEKNFAAKDRYYVFSANIFNQVGGKSSLLKLLSDHKQEIRKFIRKNQLSFHENKAQALREIAAYYDNLPIGK